VRQLLNLLSLILFMFTENVYQIYFVMMYKYRSQLFSSVIDFPNKMYYLLVVLVNLHKVLKNTHNASMQPLKNCINFYFNLQYFKG